MRSIFIDDFKINIRSVRHEYHGFQGGARDRPIFWSKNPNMHTIIFGKFILRQDFPECSWMIWGERQGSLKRQSYFMHVPKPHCH